RSRRGGGGIHGWGFVLAARGAAPRLGLEPGAPHLRSLTAPLLRDAGRRAEAGRLGGQAASTLVHPRYWEER
ncbi:spermidine synthase, partial [Streptomyces sp. NPDC002530]